MITAKDSSSQQHCVPPEVEASLLLCAVQSKPGFHGTAAQSSSHSLAFVVLQPTLAFVVLQPSLAFVVLQPSHPVITWLPWYCNPVKAWISWYCSSPVKAWISWYCPVKDLLSWYCSPVKVMRDLWHGAMRHWWYGNHGTLRSKKSSQNKS